MSKIQILIVEDVDQMRSLLEHILIGIEGVAVSSAARNGWDARLELSRRRPDLVLLDEVLPGESSLDLLKEFEARRIPVILVTGVSNLTEAAQGLPAGAFSRILKPGWKSVEEDRLRYGKEIRAAWSSRLS